MKVSVSARVTLVFPDSQVGSAWTTGHTLEQIVREARQSAMTKLRALLARGSPEAKADVRVGGEPDVTVTIEP